MERQNKKECGILISFEGSEGSGKSTQVDYLAKKLTALGKAVLKLREPGTTEIGEEIRQILTRTDHRVPMCAEAELLLFAAARAQIVREVIMPALEESKIVLCDRFLDSTVVYQGIARGLSEAAIQQINAFAVGGFLPDLTFVLDISAKVGLQRARQRNPERSDRMEQEDIGFYQKVRQGYLDLVGLEPSGRFMLIDASQEEAVISKQIWDGFRKRFTE